jgi:hypothetical protein
MLGRVTRTAKYAGAATLALLLLTGCGEGGLPEDRPSLTGTPTDRPSITRDAERSTEPTREDSEPTGEDAGSAPDPTREESEPTREEPTRDEEEPADDPEPTREEEANDPPATVERTAVIVERTQTVTATAEPEPTPTVVAGEETVPPEDTDGVPPWAWLLLLATLAGVGAVIWGLQRRNVREAWGGGLETAAGEAEWLVRRVIPDLAQAPGPQERAFVWGAATERVGALEQRLAGLAATAPDLESASRAQTLAGAVRQAHSRLDQLIAAEDRASLTEDLWAVARTLDDTVTQTMTPTTPAPSP